MESTFGTRLRLQREEQQTPLATIAERTKIKLSLLEALERGEASQGPPGYSVARISVRTRAPSGLNPSR
jgi:transcriptional regulator with XRE-family HTH domain